MCNEIKLFCCSDTDDSFVWRAHGGSEVDSDNESNRSASMVDTYLYVLSSNFYH